MKHTFKAKIYQTGINWCVDVPAEFTGLLTAEKGRINIKGQINGFDFAKTLMPVKNKPHRLFVNQAMMRGGKTALGQDATFKIEQDTGKAVKKYPTPLILTEQLKKYQLTTAFDNLTASPKKDILKYLNYVKTEETLLKNIAKLIAQLKNKERNVRIP
ncbi:MAG: YdeI/OmpD-associated family protein [Chitinophagaceae bacterium]|nr:YdeI/OmpD-associated family protein [Chitinophagaceae bacterium]